LDTGIREKVLTQISRVVVGREKEAELLLISLLARGHVLLEGVPGISKTILAKSFARCVGLDFKRIQFTPDMLPMDMVGGFVFNMKDREFEFRRGPVFTNLLLADEINRAPPKVQSALLEAMQEGQVTVEGYTQKLSLPFMVIATQNPQEFQGVYPLPENQLDRFLMKVTLSYPDFQTESLIIRRNLSELDTEDVQKVIGQEELSVILQEVEQIRVSDEVVTYLALIAQETRKEKRLSLGASPRALVHLVHCARANAYLDGRDYVIPEDIKKVSSFVLPHRLRLDQSSVLMGTVTDPAQVIQDIFTKVRPPR
jgi:MoxR-like ATPase